MLKVRSSLEFFHYPLFVIVFYYAVRAQIPVSGINIGPVYRKDVVKCSTMLEKKREFACIMAFDVKVESDARDLAQELGIRIFTADIIYHLFDQFTAYMEEVKQKRKDEASADVVFPCILKIFPHFVFNKKDPIVVGVEVRNQSCTFPHHTYFQEDLSHPRSTCRLRQQIMEGFLKTNTPLVAKVKDEWIDIGTVQSIELNKRNVQVGHRGESVAIKIQSKQTENIMYGRHFDHTNEIASKMSLNAIQLLKDNFRDELTRDDWRCVVKLKAIQNLAVK